MKFSTSRLSPRERSVVGIAAGLALAAALRFVLGASPEPPALNYLLLACNGPGLIIAAIPFVLAGGLTTAHAGLSAIPFVVVGNPIGWGALAVAFLKLTRRAA